MSIRDLILAVGLIAVLGAGAHWYLGTFSGGSDSSSEVTRTTTHTSTAATEVAEDATDDAEEVITESAPVVVAETVPADTTPTAPVVESVPTVEETLSDLDALFDDDYDDSSLDSEFSDSDVTSLTDSYGI